jgi:phosphonate transport system permease protein
VNTDQWLKDRWLTLCLVLIAALCVWSFCTIELNVAAFFSERGRKNVLEIFSALFPIKTQYVPSVWTAVLDTFRMATLGTMMAAAVAVPLSLLAAKNLHKGSRLYPAWMLPLKAVLNIFRGVDTLIWALIFVSVTGFGPTAGIFAIAVHNLGTFTKLFYETIEEIDIAPLEALEAIGASKLQTISFAVIPEVTPAFLSITLYLWEYNFRASQVLGIVGAGGIGLLLNNAIGLYDWQSTGTILVLIVVFVAAFDYVSYFLRNHLIRKNIEP